MDPHCHPHPGQGLPGGDSHRRQSLPQGPELIPRHSFLPPASRPGSFPALRSLEPLGVEMMDSWGRRGSSGSQGRKLQVLLTRLGSPGPAPLLGSCPDHP